MDNQPVDTPQSLSDLPPAHALQTECRLGCFDPDDYLEYFEGEEISEEEAKEFIETLWKIINSFVELGFKTDSVQLILEASQTKQSLPSLDIIERRGTGIQGGEG